MVHRLAGSTAPGNLLDMLITGPHPRPTKQKLWGETQYSFLTSSPLGFWHVLQFEKSWTSGRLIVS